MKGSKAPGPSRDPKYDDMYAGDRAEKERIKQDLRSRRNLESAYKSREKKKRESENVERQISENAVRIHHLEREVDRLMTELEKPPKKSSHGNPSRPRKWFHQENVWCKYAHEAQVAQ